MGRELQLADTVLGELADTVQEELADTVLEELADTVLEELADTLGVVLGKLVVVLDEQAAPGSYLPPRGHKRQLPPPLADGR